MNLPILFICGLKAERALLPKGAKVAISGGRPSYLSLILQNYSRENISEVVSFGICGGLNLALKPGNMIFDPNVIYGGLVSTMAEKIALNDRFQACDLETGTARDFATKNSLPFRVARFVADPATFTLPPAALLPLNFDGSPDYWAITKSIWDKPGQVPDLVRVKGYTDTALDAARAWVKKEMGK